MYPTAEHQAGLCAVCWRSAADLLSAVSGKSSEEFLINAFYNAGAYNLLTNSLKGCIIKQCFAVSAKTLKLQGV
ncbi:hypothetical protein Osc1_08190 [Hominimerdicola sp. 21CYCFAH17_S]